MSSASPPSLLYLSCGSRSPLITNTVSQATWLSARDSPACMLVETRRQSSFRARACLGWARWMHSCPMRSTRSAASVTAYGVGPGQAHSHGVSIPARPAFQLCTGSHSYGDRAGFISVHQSTVDLDMRHMCRGSDGPGATPLLTAVKRWSIDETVRVKPCAAHRDVSKPVSCQDSVIVRSDRFNIVECNAVGLCCSHFDVNHLITARGPSSLAQPHSATERRARPSKRVACHVSASMPHVGTQLRPA